MAAGRYPRYTAGQLEQHAATLLETAFPFAVPIPVDVDFLLESEPGVCIDVVRGLQEACGVAGAVFTHAADDRLTIVVDDAVADGPAAFYRFTVAEELGHVRLHRAVLREVRTLEDAVRLHASPSYYRDLDRNAKRFAAAVLMPADSLRRDAASFFEGLRAEIVDPTRLKNTLTVRLAQRYTVSRSAMSFRLEEWPVEVSAAMDEALAKGRQRLQFRTVSMASPRREGTA